MAESEDYDAARRMRVLRAGGYRCGVRDQRGVLCGAPACQVDSLYRYPICAYCVRFAGADDDATA